ncbi:helix-turn-helix domain-containing protein [[Kitasatospora] papulosa]|uniref:helix-turn-helix domain-containing protein n=1 Tax=[Kitasatospora] papulosa TaxID=1464011 RepID=UPI0036944D53
MHHQPTPDERRRIFGERLRAARLDANLTQQQVSLRAGIRIATYSDIEQAYSSPRLDTLFRIADAIGVPLSDLVRT